MKKEKKILAKGVLIPRVVELLKQLGEQTILEGKALIELAELVKQAKSPEEALKILDKALGTK